jgi:hypothetical protein
MGTGSDLLPAPGGLPTGDCTATLFFLQAKLQLQDIANGQTDIEVEQRFVKLHRDEEHAALERQREAQENHGFFGSLRDLLSDAATDLRHGHFADAASEAGHDFAKAISDPTFLRTLGTIGEWACLVGGVGIGGVVCCVGFGGERYGAGMLGAAAVALSIAGFVVSKTKCCGESGSKWLGLGLSVGGGLCAIGGAEAVGGAAKFGSTARVGLALSASAEVVGGAAQSLSGAGRISRAVYDHQAEIAQAAAEEAQRMALHHERQIRRISDFLEDVNASHQRALEALKGAQQARDDAASALVRYI